MNQVIRYIFIFVMLLFSQVYVFDNIFMLGWAQPVVYFLFFLRLPSLPPYFSLLLAFFGGILIDSFTYTPGINSAALLSVVFLRDTLVKYLKFKINNAKTHLYCRT